LNLEQSTDIGGFWRKRARPARHEGGYPEPSAATLDWLARSMPSAGADGAGKGFPGARGLSVAAGQPAQPEPGQEPAAEEGRRRQAPCIPPQPYDLGSTRSHRDFILDEDIAPLRLFLALQAGGGYFYNEAVDLTGETGALLLRLALRTGRLYLDGLVELPLESGAPRPLKLSWAHNLAGLQQLAFDLPPALQMIPTWPPFYLDTAAGVVGELQSDLSAHLLQQC
jgi:hypothetical protein